MGWQCECVIPHQAWQPPNCLCFPQGTGHKSQGFVPRDHRCELPCLTSSVAPGLLPQSLIFILATTHHGYIPPCPLYLSFCFLALCPALLRTLCPPSATHLLSIWNSVWGQPCSLGLLAEIWGLLISPGWAASKPEDLHVSISPVTRLYHLVLKYYGFLHNTGDWTRGTQIPQQALH